MLRTLLIALLFLSTLAHAQAPIERRPPEIPSDPVWTVFMERSSDAFNDRIRVRTVRTTQHCILTEVTPSTLICHEPVRLFYPRPWNQAIPQTRILKVETEDRSASGGIAFLAGFGLGAGLGARRSSDPSFNALIDGALLGGIASFLGYHIPFVHRTLYRRPDPTR